MPLGLVPAAPDPADQPPLPTETVKAYQRRAPLPAVAATPDGDGLRFDASVPVVVIPLPNPEIAALAPETSDVIGEKVTYRLAQRPRAYVVLKYVRSVVREVLGQFCGVLLTDGYTVYERYAQRVNGLVHAQCWSHTRRQFVDAVQVEPALVTPVLDFIGQLYP